MKVHTIHKHLSTCKLLSSAAGCGVVWQIDIYTKQCWITYQTVNFGVNAVRPSNFTYLHLITVTVTETTLHKFTFTIHNSSEELQQHVYKHVSLFNPVTTSVTWHVISWCMLVFKGWWILSGSIHWQPKHFAGYFQSCWVFKTEPPNIFKFW
jgi:hypothetical protein